MAKKDYFKRHVVKKTIIELRFNLTGEYFDNRGKMINAFVGTFDQIGLNEKQQQLGFTTKDKKTVLSTNPKYIHFQSWDSKDLRTATEEAYQHIIKSTDILNVTEFGRVGLRTIWTAEYVGKYQRLVNQIADKVYADINKLQNVFRGKAIVNFEVPIHFSLDSLGDAIVHASSLFGPMKQNELADMYGEQGSYPENALMLDLDISVNADRSKGNIKKEALRDIFDECIDLQTDASNGLYQHFVG